MRSPLQRETLLSYSDNLIQFNGLEIVAPHRRRRRTTTQHLPRGEQNGSTTHKGRCRERHQSKEGEENAARPTRRAEFLARFFSPCAWCSPPSSLVGGAAFISSFFWVPSYSFSIGVCLCAGFTSWVVVRCHLTSFLWCHLLPWEWCCCRPPAVVWWCFLNQSLKHSHSIQWPLPKTTHCAPPESRRRKRHRQQEDEEETAPPTRKREGSTTNRGRCVLLYVVLVLLSSSLLCVVVLPTAQKKTD